MPAIRSNPLKTLALFICLFYVFLRFSFIHELLWFVGFTGIVLIGFVAAVPAMFLGGAFQTTLKSRISWWWIALSLWMIVDIPFSSWRGGSINDVTSYIRVEIPILFITAGLAAKWADVRKLMWVLPFCGIINIITAFRSSKKDDRLDFDIKGASIGNSNDFAAHLLFIAPFVLFFAMSSKTATWKRIICFLLLIPASYQIINTGSRGALLALILSGLFFFLRASGSQRVGTLVFGTIGLIYIVTFASSSIIERLKTIPEAVDSRDPTNEAVASFRTREYLLRKSIQFTFENPLFGVGPGQFSSVEGGSQIQKGDRGVWQVTHNTYTQISSECGLPALFFYLGGIGATFFAFNRIAKQARIRRNQEYFNAALCGMLSIMAFGSAAFFLSLAYRGYFLFLAGLAISMTRILMQEGFWAPQSPLQGQALPLQQRRF